MHTMTVVRVILSPKDEESEKQMLRYAQHHTGGLTLSEAKGLAVGFCIYVEILRYAQNDTSGIKPPFLSPAPRKEEDR